MKIELGETDKFEVKRDVSKVVEKGESVVVTCPRCGKEVVLNAQSSSGDEYTASHFSCRIEFELVSTGYNLVIRGK